MSAASDVEQQLRQIFSNPRHETLEGVIAAGGRMTPDLLVHAYEHGIFPWPHEGYPLLWFCPDERGVIDFSDLHRSRSFDKWLKKHRSAFEVTVNKAFSEVVESCRVQKRKGQKGSWITPEIKQNYRKLQEMGKALSIEVWRGDQLVGGIYGVKSLRYFSCESMFHLETNVSKFALIELIAYLQKMNFTWMDIQMVTPVCESFGGKYISKDEFLRRIGF